MATDRRELVLERLVTIAGVTGIDEVKRNLPVDLAAGDIALNSKNRVLIYDGDEEAKEDEPGARPSPQPRSVYMMPHMVVQLARPSAVGTDLNTTVRLLKKAIESDATLKSYLMPHGIRYLGMDTQLGWGRLIEGTAGVNYRFTYPQIPSEM